MSLLVAQGLHHAYGTRVVLDGVSLEARRGELVAVRGASGSGKTTLLQCLAGLLRPTSGSVALDGRDVLALSEADLLRLRRETLAYVPQRFALLPALSAAENVGVPLRLRRTAAAEREDRVRAVLSRVGLADHLGQRPAELSGGQQQRVSLARALVTAPALLLADEPTGQLDADSARDVLALLRDLGRDEGMATIVTTHDEAVLALADRVVTLGAPVPHPEGSP